MRVIGYVRVSTNGQAKDGLSLEAQVAKIKAWSALHEVKEVIIFRDAGLSGSRSDNRPGLQDALNVTAAGDALIVYSLSRLARSTKDTIQIAEYLEHRNVDLVSLCEKIDTTTAAGKMVFRMLAVLSEFERDQVSERTRLALKHKRAQGYKTGGDVPYGYRVSDSRLIPHPTEQGVIEEIQRLRGLNYSLRRIASALEKKGIRTKTGRKHWNPKTIATILAREGSRDAQAASV